MSLLNYPTFVEALEAYRQGDHTAAVRFIDENGKVEQRGYGELFRRALCRSSVLKGLGVVKGSCVGLILPDNREFAELFVGLTALGATPIPLTMPLRMNQLGNYLEHLKRVASITKCKLFVVDARLKPLLGTLREAGVDQIKSAGELEGQEPLETFVRPGADDLAFLQFTSGSTSQPKGVCVTHGNIIANCTFMDHKFQLRTEDQAISWLPLYHDMGLIGFFFAPLLGGLTLTLMSPLAFLKRPTLWLKTMSEYKGTISFAPNFAYGLCTKRVRAKDLEELNLSSWRVAGCGAEPIQAKTLTEFANFFASTGFREEAFCPSYGLAESTLAVTLTAPGKKLSIDRVEPGALVSEGKAIPVNGSKEALEIVGCGSPAPGHEVRIVTDQGDQCGEREIGEVIARGPSVTRGYYHNEEATNAAFRDGWVYTGDLGYVAGGELYICGRFKDLIIIHGKNYFPSDIEWIVSEQENVRKGNVCAFSVRDAQGEERVIVCAEVTDKKLASEALANTVRDAILQEIGLAIDHVEFLPTGSIPKTSSGKLQRSKCRDMYLAGDLGGADTGVLARLGLAKTWLVSQMSYLKK